MSPFVSATPPEVLQVLDPVTFISRLVAYMGGCTFSSASVHLSSQLFNSSTLHTENSRSNIYKIIYNYRYLWFQQYRQMRRKEQDRLARMDADYQRRKELAAFNMRREERLKAAEERTAKKRLKRQKKKQRKRAKTNVNARGEENQKEVASSDEADSDNFVENKQVNFENWVL